MVRASFIVLALLSPLTVLGSPPPNTSVALWVTGPSLVQGDVLGAMPPRFALLEDGRVFVGGISAIASTKLASGQIKAIESQIARVKKLGTLPSPVVLGPGEDRFRLMLHKGPELLVEGDPAHAVPAFRPVATLVQTLLEFSSPDLKPYQPESFLMRLEEGSLLGGCRDWQLPGRLADLRKAPVVVGAPAAAGWPTGAHAASVCDGDNRLTVTLRPLLPGETP
jgi:hypothetical protein